MVGGHAGDGGDAAHVGPDVSLASPCTLPREWGRPGCRGAVVRGADGVPAAGGCGTSVMPGQSTGGDRNGVADGTAQRAAAVARGRRAPSVGGGGGAEMEHWHCGALSSWPRGDDAPGGLLPLGADER